MHHRERYFIEIKLVEKKHVLANELAEIIVKKKRSCECHPHLIIAQCKHRDLIINSSVTPHQKYQFLANENEK